MKYIIGYVVGLVLVYYVLHFFLVNTKIHESYILVAGYIVGHIIGLAVACWIYHDN